MADPAAESGATPDPGATPGAENNPHNGEGTGRDPDPTLGDGGKRAIAELRRELRSISKERDELRSAEQERQNAERTEVERLTAERDDLQTRIAALESQTLAREVAAEKGIPHAWHRLRGKSKEELEADADAFKEENGIKDEDPGRPGGGTVADLGAGPRSGSTATGSQGMSDAIRRRARRA